MRKFFLIFFLLLGLIFFGPMLYIHEYAKPYIYTNREEIPSYNVGLVLGTSPTQSGGEENIFFRGRIEATRALYEAGKIRHILVSGDNSTTKYNEPEKMKQALVDAGIPAENITQDFAGFRTLDSIIRAREIFGQENFIVISQGFQNERAIYLAGENGIEIIGYNAENVPFMTAPMVYIREFFARMLALSDVYFGAEATVLGEKEVISVGEGN